MALNPEQIETARELRRSGLSLDAISRYFEERGFKAAPSYLSVQTAGFAPITPRSPRKRYENIGQSEYERRCRAWEKGAVV